MDTHACRHLLSTPASAPDLPTIPVSLSTTLACLLPHQPVGPAGREALGKH